MRRRRWDVRTRGMAAPIVIVVLVAACGQARLAAPPEPAFTHGRPAQTTVPVTSEASTVVTEHPEPEAIEPDLPDPIAPDLEDVELVPESTEPDPGGASVDSMVIVDDAGVRVPNQSGWDAFDVALSRRLIPADVSASVAVLVDGALVHQAAYGERIAGSGEPAAVTDRFRIASISKTITAIVVMQMVERGELTLDDPVGRIVIDHLGIAVPDPDAAGITVRQLLSHTAGFGKFRSTFFGNGATSYSDAARIGLSGSVSPGGYTYSNMSYAVLTVLIEAITGQTYERVVGDRLLAPLGFADMRMTGTFEIGPDEVSHHPTPGRNYMEALGGAGSWNATPTQVAMIYNSIDPATGGWKALAPDSMAAMRYRVPTGLAPENYGLGIINYPGEAWGHTGTIEHAHSMVLVQPDGVTWAITVSGETPSNTGTLRTMMRIALAAGFPD